MEALLPDANGRLRDMTDAELEAEIAAREGAGTFDRLLLVGWRTQSDTVG
jgi:hypothetical protein